MRDVPYGTKFFFQKLSLQKVVLLSMYNKHCFCRFSRDVITTQQLRIDLTIENRNSDIYTARVVLQCSGKRHGYFFKYYLEEFLLA